MDINIRRLDPDDAYGIAAIYEGKNAYSCTLQLPHPSLLLWQERVSDLPDNVYAYVAEVDGEVVGNISFDVCPSARRRHVGSVGLGVKDALQGQGIGSALLATVIELADHWLNIKRIELVVYVDNERAIQLYKKFGFQIEGESEAYAFRDGQYVNAYHMARVVTSVA